MNQLRDIQGNKWKTKLQEKGQGKTWGGARDTEGLKTPEFQVWEPKEW